MTEITVNLVHHEWRDLFDDHKEAILQFTQRVNFILDNNWVLRTASLDYEVDFDTKVGSWKAYIRWHELPREGADKGVNRVK